ncbi:MAG: pentapeptide repeat-containing protein [Alphaproteobacteria bacterium]|nr:pentapeptide repeat-containing protein [Alphaproteobacteria bacterium]
MKKLKSIFATAALGFMAFTGFMNKAEALTAPLSAPSDKLTSTIKAAYSMPEDSLTSTALTDTIRLDTIKADMVQQDTIEEDVRGDVLPGRPNGRDRDLLSKTGELVGANLSGKFLTDADFTNARIKNSQIRDANLHGANLQNASVHDTNLEGTDLRGTNLMRTSLMNVAASRAEFNGTNLQNAYIGKFTAQNADFTGASFNDATLHTVTLTNSNLKNTSFKNVSFDGPVVFNGANMEGVTIDLNPSVTKNATFSNVKNFDKIKFFHDGKRVRGVTIDPATNKLMAEAMPRKYFNYAHKQELKKIFGSFENPNETHASLLGIMPRKDGPQNPVPEVKILPAEKGKHRDLLSPNGESIMGNFSGQDLSEADFAYTRIKWSKMEGTDLSYANLQGAEISTADMEGANLQNANLTKADLWNLKAPEANFKNASFDNSTLTQMTAQNANFEGASFNNVEILIAADFSGSNLKNTSFKGVSPRHPLIFSNADMDGATVELNQNIARNARFDGVKNFDKIKFFQDGKRVRGLAVNPETGKLEAVPNKYTSKKAKYAFKRTADKVLGSFENPHEIHAGQIFFVPPAMEAQRKGRRSHPKGKNFQAPVQLTGNGPGLE